MTGIDITGMMRMERLPDEIKAVSKEEKDSGFSNILKGKKQDNSEDNQKVEKADTPVLAPSAEETAPEDKKEQLESELLLSGLMAQLQAAITQPEGGLETETGAEVGNITEAIEELPAVSEIQASEETVEIIPKEPQLAEVLPEALEQQPAETGKEGIITKLPTESLAKEEVESPIESDHVQLAETPEKAEPAKDSHLEKTNVQDQNTVSKEVQAQSHAEEKAGGRNEEKDNTGGENGMVESFSQSVGIRRQETVTVQRFDRLMEGTTQLKTTTESLPQDLGKLLTTDLTANGKALMIELEPEALGKLTVKAEYDGGRLVVSILSTNPKTLEVLSQRAGELAGILESRTGQETLIQTPQAEPQDHQSFERHGGEGGGKERQQEREKEQRQPDTFAQQLRLGLV